MCVFGMRMIIFKKTEHFRSLSLYLSLNCLKEFTQRAWSRKSTTNRDIYKNMGYVWWGDLCSSWTPKSFVCPIVSAGLRKHTFIKHLFFHLYVSCLPPRSAVQIPTPFLLLSGGYIISLNCLTCPWASYSYGVLAHM